MRVVADDPAFAVYLLALALLPFRWLSPIGSLYEHADWSDILIGCAAALWLLERVRARTLLLAYRSWQLPLALYLLLACASAAVAVPGRGGGFKTVLLMAELAVLAVITADFAAERARRALIARVILGSALVTVVLAVVGLALFYARVPSGLVGGYGDYIPSRLYTRVRAGFESAPLLASFCIFASGVAASPEAGLSRRGRIVSQVSLALLCVATFARGVIGFLLAAVLRHAATLTRRRGAIVAVTAGIVALAIIAFFAVGRLYVDPVKPSTISYVLGVGPRHDAFVSSLKTLGHHLLLGIGPGALPGTNLGSPFRAHFTPLNVAATLGLPALIALLAMLVMLWRDRPRPTEIALWSAAAGICLDGLAQDIDHFRHVWVLIGLLGAQRARPRSRLTSR